jgi:hypothetical protein
MIYNLDVSLQKFGFICRIEHSLKLADRLFKLWDELSWDIACYVRKFVELTKIGIQKRSTLSKGIEYTRKALEYERWIYKGLDNADTLGDIPDYLLFLTAGPQTHPNYLIIDRGQHPLKAFLSDKRYKILCA